MKKWIVKNRFKDESRLHNNVIISNLLLSRGINDIEKSNDFLNPEINGLHDPFLLMDMGRAVDRIDEAIKGREKITIYGDYDVDGITSTSILYTALKRIGADISYYIPDRISEGYGINNKAIDYIKSIGTNLIITVDCGISAVNEIEYARENGIDVIVTDHHECGEVIPDTIVVNPKRNGCNYPFKELAGCGVAFKLIQALWIKYELTGFEEFLDICSIGTIADIVELREENRIIVKRGLERLESSRRCGITALKNVSGIDGELNSYSIAFQIAPRINAAGRLSDAKIAVELFTTCDYDKAMQIAKYLDNENKNRQNIEDNILNEAIDMINEGYNLKQQRVIILSSPKWHIGVVGIVASRILERYNRPVILICEEDEIGRGSGRSIDGFNLFENISACKDLLLKFGGHELAAGITIEKSKINEFKKRLNELALKIDPEYFQSKINIDMDVPNQLVNIETAELLKTFEPFGAGNPSPVFCMEGLKVISKRGVGNKEQHLKMVLDKDEKSYDCIMFGGSMEYIDKNWDRVDAAFNMDINNWNNKKNLQFILKDLKPNAVWINEYIEENYYRYIKNTINDKVIDKDLNRIIFKKKDNEFLKEFIYFNHGYVLVSSIESTKDINFILDSVNISLGKNYGCGTQIIFCPVIEDIDFENNEVLIYDFLPGEYEYSLIEEKTKNSIYNFYFKETFEQMDDYAEELTINEALVLKFIENLSYNGVVGTIREIAQEYNINPYKMFKLVSWLKANNFIEMRAKGEVIKIELKKGCNTTDLKIGEQIVVEKLYKLKNKFKTYLEEEII